MSSPGLFSTMFSLLPSHWWEVMRNAIAWWGEQWRLWLGVCYLSGEVSLVESNGLVGTRVSVESHNLGPQSLHWPECLSGPPQTACGAGGRLNRDRDSSWFAFSSFCGGWDPLPLGVSGIAAGSERDTHLMGVDRKRRSNTPPTFLKINLSYPSCSSTTNLFSLRRWCCYCCLQPLPWL